MRCEYVANGLQQRGERMRMRCLQIANTWQTDCNNVANGCECAAYRLRMRGERIATMQHSKNKNHTFVTQKPPFCTSKTILLHVKNHTFAWWICNIQKTNTLQTFRECVANTPKWDCKTFRNIPTYTHEIGCEPIADALRTDCQTLLTVCHNAAKHAASFGTPHDNAPTYKHKKTYKIYNRIWKKQH